MQGSHALNGYLTVQNTGEYEYVVQKSRFIGRCWPVTDQQQAESLLDGVRKRCWDAAHNCYAFRIGPNAEAARSSDDGEPSGTAGMPILQCMASMGATDALVVVTRYFGGVLLGAGGLVRAYSHTAAGAIQRAGLVRMARCTDIAIEIPYPLWPVVERCLRENGCDVHRLAYGESVRAGVYRDEADAERLIRRIVDLTDGRVRPTAGGTVFRPVAAAK